jgi:WD40 repeat protein
MQSPVTPTRNWIASLAIGLIIAAPASPAHAKVRIVTSTTRPAAPAAIPAASPHVLKLTAVAQASFSPDGQVLMTLSDQDHQIHFWNARTGEEVNRFGVAVRYAVFSESGNRVMTWDDEKLIRIFDARTGKALRRIEGAGEALAAATISKDGTRVLTCATGQSALKLWDATTSASIAELPAAGAPTTILAFSPDQTRALSVAAPAPAASSKPSLSFWDLQNHKLLQKIELPSPATAAGFSTSGKLALVQINNARKIYDVDTGKEATAPPTDETFSTGQTTPDGMVSLAIALGSASITNALTGEIVRPLEAPIDGLPMCRAFSTTAPRIILGTGKAGLFSRNPDLPGSVYVYDVNTGKRLAAFTGHGHQVTQVGLSPDGQSAFSRDSGKTLFLWALGK